MPVSFRTEDLLAEFQDHIFSAVFKAGDFEVLERSFITLIFFSENDFADAFLDTLNLMRLMLGKSRMPNSASIFQDWSNIGLKDSKQVLSRGSIFSKNI